MKISSLEYSEFILGSLEHLKPKVNIFDVKKKNSVSTSCFQDKYTFYVLVILLMFDF